MKLKKGSVCTLAVQKYLYMVSVTNENGILSELVQVCPDVANIYRNANVSTKYPVLLWASIDETLDTDPPSIQEQTISNISIRIDDAKSYYEAERFSIGISFRLVNPFIANFFPDGRAAYRKWLIKTFLEQLKSSVASTSPELTSLLYLNTRAWVYGQTSRLFGYDADGNQRVFNESLPEQEEAYVNPGFFFGPPLDGPPYTRGKNGAS